MSKFVGFTTYGNEDTIVFTEQEYEERGGLPEDWDEYVWIEAESKSEAYARYDDCIAEYMDDVAHNRPEKQAY